MKRLRPNNEPTGLELIVLVFFAALCLLATACCPKVIQQPPVIINRWDTAAIMLAPPPPFVVPADSSSLTIDLNSFCDSLWRSDHLYRPIISIGKRLQTSISMEGTQIKFKCKEDSLIHELDSLHSFIVNHMRIEYTEIVVEKCPLGWPKWYHHSLLIMIGILILAFIIQTIRAR